MYDIIIIGSGISSMCFLDSLNTNNKKIALLSASFESEISSNVKNMKLYQNLPPRFSTTNNKNLISLENFFSKNNIHFDKNLSIFGLLDNGGVSNYWGASCQFIDEKKINFLNKNNRKELIKSFNELYEKYNFSGFYNSSLENKKKIKNKKVVREFEEIIEKCSNEEIKFYKNCIAFDDISNKMFTPKNFGNKIFNKVENINYFVKKISKEKNFYKIYCESLYDSKEHIIISKKIILATGTLTTSKLVCEMLEIDKKIDIDHNPMLFGLFLFKKSITEQSILLSKVAAEIHSKKSKLTSVANLRGSNNIIKKKIFENYFFMKNYLSKYLYNILDNKFLFINLYLDSEFGCMSFKRNKDTFIVEKILFSLYDFSYRRNRISRSSFIISFNSKK